MTKLSDVLNAPTSSRAVPVSRQGKKHVGVYVDPAVAQQLRIIAATDDISVQQLIERTLVQLIESRNGRRPD